MPGQIAQYHGRVVTDYVDLEGQVQGNFATGVASASSAGLVEGVYDIWATADTYVLVDSAGAAVPATIANGYLLRANNTITVVVRPQSRFTAILASGTGTLAWFKVA